jgi:hypothetical protein
MILAGPHSPAQAQIDFSIRNSFPGRRIGGNTRSRNICWTRQFAHLVPVDSIVAPGQPAIVGILEGPTNTPRQLQIELRRLTRDGQSDTSTKPLFLRQLPPAPVGITLLTLPTIQQPVSWITSYVCDEQLPTPDDLLFFITSGEPPALSLLLPAGSSAEDLRNREAIEKLRRHCGGSVGYQAAIDLFAFTGLEGPHWPQTLPVRCP